MMKVTARASVSVSAKLARSGQDMYGKERKEKGRNRMVWIRKEWSRVLRIRKERKSMVMYWIGLDWH